MTENLFPAEKEKTTSLEAIAEDALYKSFNAYRELQQKENLKREQENKWISRGKFDEGDTISKINDINKGI